MQTMNYIYVAINEDLVSAHLSDNFLLLLAARVQVGLSRGSFSGPLISVAGYNCGLWLLTLVFIPFLAIIHSFGVIPL